MAKSSKKTSAKGAKKPSAKAKPTRKAKKSTHKKAKVAPKKAAKKALKKIVAKKQAPKKEVKKVVAIAKAPEPKRIFSTPASRKQEAMALPKTPPQLNIFPALTQRPIAHKSTKASTTPEDKTRYSEVELKEFETLIKSKLAKARDEFRILKDTLNRNNDAGTDATSGGNTKVLEDGA